jgi:hypothetical protein
MVVSADAVRSPWLALTSRAGAPPLGIIFLGVGLVLGMAVWLLGLDRLGFTFCYFKAFTGWPCPSCGTTRALARLVRGDLAGGLAMNPLTATGILAVVPWAAADALLLARGRALSVRVRPALRPALVALAVAAGLANWAYLVSVGR